MDTDKVCSRNPIRLHPCPSVVPFLLSAHCGKILIMAKENSFDIVSKTDYAEVTNAIHQTTKEVSQRFDFKGSKATVELQGKDLMLSAEDDTKLRNMNDILQGQLGECGIS